MPWYEYRCESCGAVFEVIKEENKSISCARCGSSDVKRLFSGPSLIKSEGYINNGKTCCGRDERCTSPPCSNEGKCIR